ncbi:MAG: cation transporter [Eubacterium sp.]|nr:cation transporter [Eubacterium sp.]
MKNVAIKAGALGLVLNFLLFLLKLYIGISANSLAIYCDAVNNLGDSLACVVALSGFWLMRRLGEKQSLRAQSLCTFIISLLIAVTGFFFIYHGTERLMYPTPVSYLVKYAVLLAVTIAVKLLMGWMFRAFRQKEDSSVLRALELDCYLDCFVTAAALMSLVLNDLVRFAVDGTFAIIAGGIITVSAIKNLVHESKYLINN